MMLFELFTPGIFDDLSLEISDNKSSQVCRTLLSILADLNNSVTWKVSTRPRVSKSSILLSFFFSSIWELFN